ncbi:MAG: DUF6444 domain-containing protein [Actinobacteria bacterium]|nr:DUF6444 domain-containing protein [Actinomycetota bacterium]
MPGPEELSRAELIELAAAQARRIEELEATNTALTCRVERLERLVSRNSRNSSMPPSKDGEPGKTAPDAPGQRGGRGRKRGKQPGAPGAHLAWREDPDERVDRFPEGRCECGAELAGAADLGVSDRYQQTEIGAGVGHDHPVRAARGAVWLRDGAHREPPRPAPAPAGSATARTCGRGVCI